MGSYCFRIRFRIDQGSRLGFDGERVSLDAPELDDPLILRSHDGDSPISNTDHLVLESDSVDSEELARDVGQHAYGALLWCGLKGNYGFDLGSNPPGFGIFNAFKRKFKEATGYQLLEDVHGLQVYDCSEDTKFMLSSAEPLVTKNPGHFHEPWQEYVSVLPRLEKSEIVGLELWNVAYFETSPRARFLTRMLAVEAVLPEERSSPEARALIDRFQDLLDESDVAGWEEESLSGRLGHLKNRSIRQRGKNLASRLLNQNQYLGEGPADYFDVAYNARSNLVHEGTLADEDPPIRDLDHATKKFASDLLEQVISSRHSELASE